MDYREKARRLRDAKLRGKLLFVLFETASRAPTGFMSARQLINFANMLVDESERFESDEHALSLIRYLVSAGYAEERQTENRMEGEKFTPELLRFAITAKGQQMQEHVVPPDPMIADGRIIEK